MPAPKYSRILLKLSGESFKGEGGFGIDPQAVSYMASQVRNVSELGVEPGAGGGGGNIWRGAEGEEGGMDRATADYAGMLATVINALALQDSLERVHSGSRRASRAPSRSRRSRSRTSGAGRYGTWKRAAWSCSRRARATRL